MPGISKKNVKRPTSPQATKRKPREQPKQRKPSVRKKGTRSAKKTKKGVFPDIWQAALLTAVLVATSVIVSIVILGIRQKTIYQADLPSPTMELPEITITEAAVLETPPVQDRQIPVTPTLKPPQEKQPPTAPAPKITAKAPAKEPQNQQPTKTPAVKTPAARTPASAPIAAIPEPPPKPKYQGTLVFIIDDAGNNLQELEPFLRFPGPLTIAVLPGLPHSAEAARRIRAAGKEVFLHQPMEAVGGQAPGPGAIYAGMTAAEVVALLRQNVAEIGPIAGMNNHQGSKITTDQQIMETVLAFCREQGLCFLDSRTTAETAVPAAARNLGIKIGERNIFIDNEQNRASMNRFIESGLTLASQKGSAVMIGHTWSPELAPLLADLYQDLLAQGYTFATASALIR